MATVPQNQTVSWTTYFHAVQNALPVPYAFFKENMKRIEQAFDYGEPVSMIDEEMKLRWEMKPTRSKTPRQMAIRVVRL